MAGTVYGKVDCYSHVSLSYFRNSYVDGPHVTNEIYVGMYTFLQTLQSNGVVELVTMNTGSGGNGVGYWDQATKFGPNAFSVWKWKANANRPWDWYLYIHCVSGALTTSNTPNASPTRMQGAGIAPGNGEGRVIYQAAIGVSADGSTSYNPWNGTINTSGAAFKGFPVWSTGALSTNKLFVFPRANSNIGSYTTAKEICSDFFRVYDGATNNRGVRARYHFLADSDSFVFVVQGAKQNAAINSWNRMAGMPGYHNVHYVGPFNLVASISQSNPGDVLGASGSLGFLQLAGDSAYETCYIQSSVTQNANTFPIRSTIGVVGGGFWDGGMLGLLSEHVMGFQLGVDQTSPGYFKNSLSRNAFNMRNGASVMEEYPINVIGIESARGGNAGWIDTPLMRLIQLGQNYLTSDNGLRTIFGGYPETTWTGNGNITYYKISTCWSGSNPPGVNNTRDGFTFTLTNP